MKIELVKQLLEAKVVCGEDMMDTDVCSACGSDMMSDVLAYVKDQAVLLTGLVNEQVIRTAAMMDMKCVVFARNKRPTQDMVSLADNNGIAVLTTPLRMFEACGKLYEAGLNRDGVANA